MSKIGNKINAMRARIAFFLFPATGGLVCANRTERTWRTPKFDFTLMTRNKQEPDAYSDEEMLRFMDIYCGRKIDAAEIDVMRDMKEKKEKIMVDMRMDARLAQCQLKTPSSRIEVSMVNENGK